MREALSGWTVCNNIHTEFSEATMNAFFERLNRPPLNGYRSTIHDVNVPDGESGQNRTIVLCPKNHHKALEEHGELKCVLPDDCVNDQETAALQIVVAACAATLVECGMTADHVADRELLRTPPGSLCQSTHREGHKAFINFIVPVTSDSVGSRGTYVPQIAKEGEFCQPHIPKGGALRFPSKMPHYGPGNQHGKGERRNIFISFPAEKNSIGHYTDELVLFEN